MNKYELTQLLKRPISSTSEFDKLIEKPDNVKTQLKKGDTFYSVSIMKVWVYKYFWQVAKLAKYLQGKTVQETAIKTHNFLYKHIQYQADGYVQKIRSPANSWLNRQKGIDCKSYSIFASCILSNLGIKHYIRQIKQPKWQPNKFTHVYVVVPIDQETGSLSKGHYVIDGTILSNKEPNYKHKEDIFMASDDLPHEGLNGAAKAKAKKTKTKRTPAKASKSKSKKEKTSSKKIFSFL